MPSLELVGLEVDNVKHVRKFTSIKDLKVRYPNRSNQVDMLSCLFETSVRQAEYARSQYIQRQRDGNDGLLEEDNAIDPYVPPPIFVTGPSGTGKSSIVRDILNVIQQKAKAKISSDDTNVGVGVAYTNCSTFEPCNIGSLLKHLYNQLQKDLEPLHTKNVQKSSRKKKGKKRSWVTINSGLSNNALPPLGRSNDGDKHQAFVGTDHYDVTMVGEGIDDDLIVDSDGDDNQNASGKNKLSVEDEEDWIEEQRKKSSEGEREDNLNKRHKSKKVVHTSVPKSQSGHALRRSSRFSGNVNPPIEGHIPRPFNVQQSRHKGLNIQTPMLFGRAISTFCGKRSIYSQRFDCSFLILDHAECLLRFSPNLLSQFLVLSKSFGMNLTVIVITNHIYLENLSEYFVFLSQH